MPRARSKTKTIQPIQISEGAWHRVGNFDYHECCDCGLTHKEEFKLVRGVLYWRTYRDDKQTATRRKALGIAPIRRKQKGKA